MCTTIQTTFNYTVLYCVPFPFEYPETVEPTLNLLDQSHSHRDTTVALFHNQIFELLSDKFPSTFIQWE